MYIANNGVQVFIEYASADGQPSGSGEWWNSDPYEIFTNQNANFGSNDDAEYSKLYNGESRVFSLYLTETKTYEIKFGNGISGRKLKSGDRIHIFYLDTNGPNGEIDPDKVNLSQTRLQHDPGYFGISQEEYIMFFGSSSLGNDNLAEVGINPDSETGSYYTLTLDVNSVTGTSPEETVESIRE